MATDATLPTCARHPDRETRHVCARCGAPVCDLCRDAARDVAGCPTCAAQPLHVTPSAVGSVAGGGADRDAVTDRPAAADPPAPPAGRQPTAATVARRAPVTFALLAVVAVVFLATQATGGDFSPLLEDGAQINELVRAGQWWRLLTATLLHANVMHVLFNGYALYALGAQLERGVGSAAFAALYVAAGLAGGIAFVVAAPEQVAIGASGAIFGLFGAWFAAAWVNRDTPAGRAGLSQFGFLLLINLALPLFIPSIAWQAHLGGLLAGIVVGLAWARGRRTRPRDASRAAWRVAPPAVLSGLLLLGLLWYTMA